MGREKEEWLLPVIGEVVMNFTLAFSCVAIAVKLYVT